MFLIAGVTGNVGGAAAKVLLDGGHAVRSLVRDRSVAAEWSDAGVDLVEGDLTDARSLADALRGVHGAFLMQPTPMAVSRDFPEAKALTASIETALRLSPPPRLVVLSSVGSERSQGLGNITQTHLLEEALTGMAFPIAFVRAGALMENFLASFARAKHSGVFESFLQPIDRAFPMVATKDVGAEVARLLTAAPWHGHRVLEVGSRITPKDVADGMAKAHRREVVARAIPRGDWDASFSGMGLPPDKAETWAEMQDGFNSGWIDFGRPDTEPVASTTSPADFFASARPTTD